MCDKEYDYWENLINTNNINKIKKNINSDNIDTLYRDESLLMIACNKYKLNIIKLLLEAGANVNLQNDAGSTALILLCGTSHLEYTKIIEIIELLVEAGANLNLKDEIGETALIEACRHSNADSNIKIIELLIKAGADLNIKGYQGCTSLMYVCEEDNIESNTVGNTEGNTENNTENNTEGNVEIVKLLIQNNADLNLQNDEGWTALMLLIVLE